MSDYIDAYKKERGVREAEFERTERGNRIPKIGYPVYSIQSKNWRLGDTRFLTETQDNVITDMEAALQLAGDGAIVWEMKRIR
jgi:hypothetical protein